MRPVDLKYRGFTLMEVVVSVFIMSLIVMIVLPVFSSIMEARHDMEQSGERHMREAQALMNIMQIDLSAAFLSDMSGEKKFTMTNNSDLEGNSFDEIYFTSFSYNTTDLLGNSSDQCEIGYFVRDEDNKKRLYRRVSRIIDENLTEGGVEMKLIDSVEFFDIVKYDGGFTSESDITIGEDESETAFPAGLLIKIGIKGEDGRINMYETAMVMPAYGEPEGEK